MDAFYQKDNVNDYRTTALRRVREGKDNVKGKVVVVTGATGSLGKELSFALYNGGAIVVMTGRSMEKAKKSVEEVRDRSIPSEEEFVKIDGGDLVPMVLDVGDYDSIKSFVKDLESKYGKGKVFALVNNAGVVPGAEYKESKYGIETTFQLNFLSTIVLTELVIPLLSKDEGRIVNLSSMSHGDASKPIKWDKIPSTKETFGGYNKDYAESKWLLTAYTAHLSRRFSSAASSSSAGLMVMSADPGASPDSPMWDQQAFIIRFLARYVFYKLTKRPNQAAGCAAQLVASSKDSLKNGGYYQSGVLVPPLRPDCENVDEWNKASKILVKLLPDDWKQDMAGKLEG